MEVFESLVTSALSVGQATSGSLKFPQTGPEVINKLGDLCTICRAGQYLPFLPRALQTEPEVVTSLVTFALPI